MPFPTKRDGKSVIHKLQNREVNTLLFRLSLSRTSEHFDILLVSQVYGSFRKNLVAPGNKAKLLFGDIPPRLKFHLKSVIEDIGK